MPEININVPQDLRDFINDRAAELGFSEPTEYVRHLIRNDRVRARIAQGLAQARAGDLVDGEEAMERIRGELIARAGKPGE